MNCTCRFPSRPVLLLCVATVAACAAAVARAEPKYVGWTKVEACRELRELKEKLREGGQFDATARQFLEETALPQLALDENRPLIERTRKRIRELLLGDVGEDKAYGDISLLVAEFMTALARDEQADPVVRVNAMLLVSELKAKNGKPWPPAALALAAAAGDKGLPDAVRIAALAGVAKHVAAGGGDEAIAKTFGPPVSAILGEPVAAERTVEQEWLVSRALQIVPLLVRPAPPKLAATLAGLVADETRSIDLRARAAAALGATVDATSGVDAAALVETIRKLAITALESEEKAAAARRFEEQYRRGGAAPGGPPGAPFGAPPGFGFDGQPLAVADPLAISEQACRRAAWRLFMLGTAIVSADEKQGLATLMGDAAGPAKELAKQLTGEALTLDSDPVEDALLDALDVLRPPAAGEKAAKRPVRQPKPDEPAGDEKKPPTDPNASPFDNPFQ
ncbi:MAG: hypothetical protein WCR51_01270 [Planctomycetia bacterium]